jgi:hypothetical protein
MSEVALALTTLGKQVVSNPDGFIAGVFADLLNYGRLPVGGVDVTSGPTDDFALTSTDPPTFPAGATAGCSGRLFVGPNTSCPFAENVEKAYESRNGNVSTISVFSLVTGKTYLVQCTGWWPTTCRSDTNAIVEFYPEHM